MSPSKLMSLARRGAQIGASAGGGADPTGAAIKAKLTAWWSLDEASGQRNDSHTNALHMTDNNTVTQGAGKVGNATQHDRGNAEHLSHADDDLFTPAGAFGVGGWIYLDDTGFHTIFSKHTSSGSNREYVLWFFGDSDLLKWYMYPDGGSSSVIVTANDFGVLSAATWYFVMCWYDEVNINISINDGTPDSTAHNTGITNKTSPFKLGSYNTDADTLMDGRLDEMFFLNDAPTAGEITWLYNAGAGRAYADLG